MKIYLWILFVSLFTSMASAKNAETWAYLMKGEERFFPAKSSITDVACFSAAVDADGYLSGGHLAPPKLPGAPVRYHLVITIPWSTTLTHIYLNPDLPFRARIIQGIVERAARFDGIQIDIESVAKADGAAYFNFLTAVKAALPPGKLFSVAVMARWADHKKANPDDAFDYPFIAMIADRVIVMAYDEHHRGGSAGPIASLPWCRKIFDFAVATIPAEKLVMGVPLYGRSWQTESTAQAYRNPEIWTDLRVRGLQAEGNANEGGSYFYTTNVTIRVHFESTPSLNAKRELYLSKPIRGLAYWRISQEPIGFWDH